MKNKKNELRVFFVCFFLIVGPVSNIYPLTIRGLSSNFYSCNVISYMEKTNKARTFWISRSAVPPYYHNKSFRAFVLPAKKSKKNHTYSLLCRLISIFCLLMNFIKRSSRKHFLVHHEKFYAQQGELVNLKGGFRAIREGSSRRHNYLHTITL